LILGAQLIALLAAGGAPRLEAQVLYGSIVGNVKDGTGAPVPGAEVTITNVETKLSRQAVAEATGAYSFSTFGLRDKVNLQLRVEVFNVTNTPHFENPGNTSSDNNVSNMQLNPDGSIRNLNGYAEVTRSYGERQMRVGLRLGF
jgi:hypothetical protein